MEAEASVGRSATARSGAGFGGSGRLSLICCG